MSEPVAAVSELVISILQQLHWYEMSGQRGVFAAALTAGYQTELTL